jgi:squalene-associated FAD-dependent desaturase
MGQVAAASARRCVVIGGGLAGLSTSFALMDAGWRITLVERRPYLGGRAFSFVDQETGREVDNGQHVFLHCCTAYRAFLRRLGAEGHVTLQSRLNVPVLSPDGGRCAIAATPWLPAPLHLLPAVLGYRHLSVGERLNTLRVLLAAKAVDRRRHHSELDRQTFQAWLVRHGERERAIRRFWNLVVLPTLNDDASVVSAYWGLMVFQEALFAGRHGGEIGCARVGLTELVDAPARAIFRECGGELVLGKGVSSLCIQGGRATGVALGDGTEIQADAVVSTAPWSALATLLPEAVREHPGVGGAMLLESSPIVGIHVWYDRPVMEDALAAFVDSPLQYVFNKTRIMGLSGPGQYLCVSLSGAWEYVSSPKETLREQFLAELARAFPAARSSTVERFIVVRQPGATFRATPGADALRPAQTTPIANLFLAGDWTQTGWPSTMESAVRSGTLAAQAVQAAFL